MTKAGTALLEDDDDQNQNLDGQITDDDQDQDDQDHDQDNQDDQDDDGEQEGQGDEDDQEIFLDGDDGSHPKDEQRGIRKRINKLNAKVAEAKTGQDQSTAELAVERERNRLLQLALNQQQQQNQPVDGPPDPNDFDDGIADAGYVTAFQNHIAKGVRAEMQTQHQTTQVQTRNDDALQARQVAHYKKADALKVKDYDDTEDAAIAILGQDVTNQLITASDKSPEVLYYLGKNPDAAKDIKALIESNPVKGVLKLGALEARLKSRPKAKQRNAPDPDGELSGGGSGKRKTKRGPTGATFE